jgi:hypothetical protein
MSTALATGGANASTVMAIGGWTTFKAMCGYTKIDEGVAIDGYTVAMKRSKELRAE